MTTTDEYAAPAGAWRFDPFTRVLRYVTDEPFDRTIEDPDDVDEAPAAAKPVALRGRSKYGEQMKECADCPTRIRVRATRCDPCYRAYRRANAKSPGYQPKGIRPNYWDPTIDDERVARVLARQRTYCNLAERLEVMRRWDGTWAELERVTGWNVSRMRREQSAALSGAA